MFKYCNIYEWPFLERMENLKNWHENYQFDFNFEVLLLTAEGSFLDSSDFGGTGRRR